MMNVHDYLECRRNYSAFDLYDLTHDNPELFRRIIEDAINGVDGFGYDQVGVSNREREIAEITAIQWEITSSSLPPTKASLFDNAVMRIKNEFLWANVQPDDRVEVVFWQDVFDPFVSFARRSGRSVMMKLLNVSSNELREAGFSPDYLSRIIAVINEWAERQLNPDMSEFEKEQEESTPEDENNDTSEDILSFFFAEETDEDEQ